MAKVCIFCDAAESKLELLDVQAFRGNIDQAFSTALEKLPLLCNPGSSWQETGNGCADPITGIVRV